MDALEFQTDLLRNVENTAEAEGWGKTEAFVAMMAEYLEMAEELPDYVPVFYSQERGSRKGRTDGYFYDPNDSTLTLLIADFQEERDRTLTTLQAEKLFLRLRAFISGAVEGKIQVDIGDPVADLIDILRNQEWEIHKYRLFLLTDARMSTRIRKLDSQPIHEIETTCQIWDIDRVHQIAESEAPREKIEIDFAQRMETGLPCLKVPAQAGKYQSYLCIIPGTVLADMYDEYGSRLLEGNVRSFLSVTRKVNKAMRQTIKSAPEMFLAYNNGIAATAHAVETKQVSDGLVITKANDLQIINGGQTTASLSNTRYKDKADLRDISVQMKLTIIDTDDQMDAAHVIQNISRSSNSQTKVDESDFAALHPFHSRMEEISRRITAPAVGTEQHGTKWFYERATGQYLQAQMRMTPTAKAKFLKEYPKKQKISKTDFAKYRNSWEGQPHLVSKGAQTNFQKFSGFVNVQWDRDEDVYNDGYYKETVGLALLYKSLEKIVTNQPWYEGGYRANVVTYTLALFALLIKEQFPDHELNLMRIWQRQAVSALTLEILKSLTTEVITEIKNGSGVRNVTQWCKQEACWDRVKKIRFPLPDALSVDLVSKYERNKEKKNEKRDQKLVNDTQCQAAVLERSPHEWKQLWEFANRNQLLRSEEDVTALRYAARSHSLPTGRQARRLMQLWDEAAAEGFAPTQTGQD